MFLISSILTKRILQTITCLMLISCIMVSCSEDSSENSQNARYVKKLNVIIPDLLIGDETTTMSVVRENSSLQLLPRTNDSIGVFPDDDFQIGFSMTNGEGFKRALSGGKSLILKDSATYSAYYPYVSQFNLDKSNIPMRMDEQDRTGMVAVITLAIWQLLTRKQTRKNV